MSRSPSFGRAPDDWLPWAAAALLVVPVLLARYPPMTDLPLFEGALALLRHWGDPAFVPPHVYQLNLGRTTQLAFAIALPLAHLTSTATACKLLVSACVVSLVVGTARLARSLGGTPLVALLVAPVALGWITFIGFVAYLFGTALWTLSLPALDRWAAGPTVRRGVVVCALVVLLHLAHLSSSACGAVAIVVLGLARGVDRRTPLRLAPAALSVILAALDMSADRANASAAALAWSARGTVWPPVRIKLTMLGDYLFGAVGAFPEWMMVALTLAALVSGIALREGTKGDPPVDPPRVGWRFAALAAVLLLAYFASPFAIGAGGYVDARFLPPAWLAGVAAASRAIPSRVPPLFRVVGACIPLAWLAVVWPVFADSNQEQGFLAEIYPHVERGSAIAVLPLGDQGEEPYLRVSAGNRALAELGGRALYSLVEAPRAPVLVERSCRWDDAVLRLYGSGPAALVPPFDATRFRYLLLRIPSHEDALAAARGLAPDYRPEAAAGPWILFGSTHPTVPLDAPDDSPPRSMPTLAERVASAVR